MSCSSSRNCDDHAYDDGAMVSIAQMPSSVRECAIARRLTHAIVSEVRLEAPQDVLTHVLRVVTRRVAQTRPESVISMPSFDANDEQRLEAMLTDYFNPTLGQRWRHFPHHVRLGGVLHGHDAYARPSPRLYLITPTNLTDELTASHISCRLPVRVAACLLPEQSWPVR